VPLSFQVGPYDTTTRSYRHSIDPALIDSPVKRPPGPKGSETSRWPTFRPCSPSYTLSSRCRPFSLASFCLFSHLQISILPTFGQISLSECLVQSTLRQLTPTRSEAPIKAPTLTGCPAPHFPACMCILKLFCLPSWPLRYPQARDSYGSSF
jgi:hypothetical protein